jgi:HEAT repeat protein
MKQSALRPAATPKKNSVLLRSLPRTAGRRVILGLSLSLLALLITLAVIVGSVWIEDRFPSDDALRALSPRAQRAVTRPIVNALSRQIENHIRSEAEAVYMNTGLTLEETIVRFLDERIGLGERRVYAYRLARAGSPECIAALLKVLQTAPPEHKAFMAQLIGSTGNSAAKAWLTPLLDDPSAVVVTATIRGLSAIGGEDVGARIAAILADGARPDSIRIEAALGLGTMGTPAASEALTQVFHEASANGLQTEILKSLGRFDFPIVANMFEQYVAAPETPSAMRVVAVEALAQSSAEAVPFLLRLADGDSDSEVRASAAWAMSAHHQVENLGPALADLAQKEPAAEVRRRLYEALLPQAGIPSERLLPLVQAEKDVAARVAGFNVVGHLANREPESALALAFDRDIVPELLQIATAPNSVNIQMRAVFALRRAQTGRARAALAEIASGTRPQIALAARNGLHAREQ